METFSYLLALCEANPPVADGFPSQRASNVGFHVLFDVSFTISWTNSQMASDLRHHDPHVMSIYWYEYLSSLVIFASQHNVLSDSIYVVN